MKFKQAFTAFIVVGLIISSGATPARAKVSFGEFLTGIPAAQGHWSNTTWETERSRIQRANRATFSAPSDASWIQRSIRRTQHVELAQAPSSTENIQYEEVPAPQGRPRFTQPENVAVFEDPGEYYQQGEYPGESISGPSGGCNECTHCQECGGGCEACAECGGCCECGESYSADDFWAGYEVGARMGGPFPHLAGTTWVLFSKYLSLNIGVQSFKGPTDLRQNGNYGFSGGANLGIPFGYRGRLGLQAGVSFVTSDFSGYTMQQTPNSSNTRNQVFFTAGIFKRAECGGWQWGMAFDIMSDSFYDESTLTQIRPEIGYVYNCGRSELGFFGAYGLDNQEVIINQGASGVYQSVDLNAFFYRRYFTYGGEGRIWAGFSGWGDGLVGADLRLPVGESLAVEGGFNYLIPRGSKGSTALDRESWGLTLNLVWTPTRCARQESRRHHRPLFGVANNNTFMTHLKMN